ncbi:UNVERIFIED_CONTAM: hypothetical protein FKN15_001858 [Acipenser sinensis]
MTNVVLFSIRGNLLRLPELLASGVTVLPESSKKSLKVSEISIFCRCRMPLTTMNSMCPPPNSKSMTETAGSVFAVKTPPWWTKHNDTALSAGEPETRLSLN